MAVEWDVIDASTGYRATRTLDGTVEIRMAGSPLFRIETDPALSLQDSYVDAADRMEKFAALREKDDGDEGGLLRGLALLTLRRAINV